MRFSIGAPLALGLATMAAAADAPPVPVTRPELKQMLEGSKRTQPRLPLPPPTAEERAAAGQGEWGLVNNARMRRLYLPPELGGGGSSREPDPGMTLDPTFKTMLFWIVSRANNCRYCLGHQESKLAAAGVAEDQIAALDGDWAEHTEAERAAFSFTRRLTVAPHAVTAEDLDGLRRHYTELQVLEIVVTVAGYNATNRWTGGLAIPQEEHRVYLSPTSAQFQTLRSRVAPLDPDRPAAAGAPPARRPALETRAEVEAALARCRRREPRLPLVDEARARAALPPDTPSGPLPEWVRLLANFPRAGIARMVGLRAAHEKGRLSPLLKAQVAWIAARHDRAWYALGHARARLAALGCDDDAIFALDSPRDDRPAADRAAFAFVRKLTVDPALIGDDDVAGLRRHFRDPEVAELIHHITNAAFFDRLTEAAGLRLEEDAGAAHGL
jgi:AhpD family alkylhydroperoxidase